MKKMLLTLLVLITAHFSFACTASFTSSSYAYGSSLLNYYFSNTSSYGTTTGYSVRTTIYFGDSTSMAIDTIGGTSHNYSATGTYTVSLAIRVYDSATGTTHCSDSTASSVTVSYPSCGFTIATTYGTGGAVTYTATCPAGTSSLHYYWTFGDGTSATGNPVTHTYSYNGVYNVSVRDTNGAVPCTYYNSTTATVLSTATDCSKMHSGFITFPSVAILYFDNTTLHPLTKATANWDFGDGSTSTTYSPRHAYTVSGIYTVKLRTSYYDSLTSTLVCRDTADSTVIVLVPNTITGYIYRDSSVGPHVPDYKIWLITYDSATSIISAIDSTTAIGSYANYTFDSVATGSYLVKAMITNGPSSGAGYVPTYHDSSVYWSGAQYISHTSGTISYADIFMQKGTVTTGPGFVGGNVLYGAGRSSGTTGTVGAPVVGLIIYIRNSSNKVLASSITDASGNYSFSNLPIGSYSIYPESMGLTTTPATAVVSASSVSVHNVNFKQNSTSIAPIATSVGNTAPAQSFVIYPNPAKGHITIQWSDNATGSADITISNITGQKVYHTLLNRDGNDSNTIYLSQLQPGMYFINVATVATSNTMKLMLQ
ncbi:MAG: T9SS type A sorting domain-containing protein [Taibaiella sp.]|nr:T9SS type A sorting domain-containing protein [Taibaiella sp.]